MKSVSVIGGGLAGCEAAYVIAESGIHVNLFEMKPGKHSPAHKTDDLCELVCSNSLRSDKLDNAVGLLKEELRRMDSLVMRIADETRVPAGGALAWIALIFQNEHGRAKKTIRILSSFPGK